MFFREAAYEQAEDLRMSLMNVCSTAIQACVRRFLRASSYRRLRVCTVRAQTQCRVWLARQSVMRLRRHRAATRLQAQWRQWRASSRYRQLRRGVWSLQMVRRQRLASRRVQGLREGRAARRIWAAYRWVVLQPRVWRAVWCIVVGCVVHCGGVCGRLCGRCSAGLPSRGSVKCP